MAVDALKGYHSRWICRFQIDLPPPRSNGVRAMLPAINRQRFAWIVLGILLGFLLTVLMPSKPLHAVATSGMDGFQLATGPLDNTIEGVYCLDQLTGLLKGAAMNVNNWQLTSVFETNVMTDLKIDPSKSPKFLMVTGAAELRRLPTQFQPGASLVYIWELNSGTLAVYAVQWNIGRTTIASASVQTSRFVLLQTIQTRTVAVRP
jgi:hypothetical protein